MKNNLHFFIFFTLLIIGYQGISQVPDFSWAVKFQGSRNDQGRAVIADKDGNTYIAGSFESFTMTMGDTVLINHSNEASDMFFAKIDPQGNVLWARYAGGVREDRANCLAIDTAGDIYVAGEYRRNVIFDGITLNNPTDNSDIFLLKYHPNGQIVWAKRFYGPYDDVVRDLTTDLKGNIYLSGGFTGSVLSVDTVALLGHHDLAMFFIKMNSDGIGLWGKSAGGINFSYGEAIAVDKDDNVYFSGSYSGQLMQLDTVALAFTGDYDFMLSKFNSQGQLLWVKRFGNIDFEISSDLKVDYNGNIYLSGCYVSNALDFGGITLTKTTPYDTDMFLAKFDTNGNTLWVNTAKGPDDDYPNELSLDAYGMPYLCGTFGSTTLYIDTLVINNSAPGSNELYACKYNANGQLLWFFNSTGSQDDEATSMFIDDQNSLFLTGFFYSPDLPFGPYTLHHTGGLNSDIFLVKMQNVLNINNLDSKNKIIIHPNPSYGEINIITTAKINKIELYNSLGEIIQWWSNTINTTFQYHIKNRGIYFLKFKTDNQIFTKKIVIY